LLANNNWYLLLRLLYILCDRLTYFHSHADIAVADATQAAAEHRDHDTIETAYALALKTPRKFSFFPQFLTYRELKRKLS